MFRTVSLPIIRSLALYTAICMCHTGYADCLLAKSGWSSILILLADSQHNLHDTYLLLCVQWQTVDDGQRNCPKHVEFYSKNKFEKLVHLIGFIIRIYHDVRSSECQICIRQLISCAFFSFGHSITLELYRMCLFIVHCKSVYNYSNRIDPKCYGPSSGHFQGYLNKTTDHDMLQYYQRRLSYSWHQGQT